MSGRLDEVCTLVCKFVWLGFSHTLESLSWLPARMARKGTWWATTMPMALSICSSVAPARAPVA